MKGTMKRRIAMLMASAMLVTGTAVPTLADEMNETAANETMSILLPEEEDPGASEDAGLPEGLDLGASEEGTMETADEAAAIEADAFIDDADAAVEADPDAEFEEMEPDGITMEDAGLIEDEDPVLMSAESKEVDEEWEFVKQKTHDYGRNAVEELAKLIPGGDFFAPIAGDLFDMICGYQEPDQIAELAKQIGDLQQQITDVESSLKNHVSDVALLSGYGDTLDDIASANEVVLMNLGTYAKKNLPDNDKMVLIASVLGSFDDGNISQYYVNILKEAKVFNGTSYKSLGGRDIFQLLYDKCCSDVMFSREAKDASKAYAQEALKHFLVSYAVAMVALEANLKVVDFTDEEVAALGKEASRLYPKVTRMGDKVTEAMNKLNELVCGKNSIMTHWNSYRNINDYIFVNKRKAAPVALRSKIRCQVDYSKNDVKSDPAVKNERPHKAATPDYMKNNPLSASQVEDLATYCREKNVSLFDFLCNQMGFEPCTVYTSSALKGEVAYPAFNWESDMHIIDGKPVSETRWLPGNKNPYLVTGAQSLKYGNSMNFGRSAQPEWLSIQAINATSVGAGNETAYVYSNSTANKPVNHGTMMFFQAK